jgi:hypothetical protein
MGVPSSGAPDAGTSEEPANGPPDPTAVLNAALGEFGKLRDEIAGRSTTLWTLVALNATASSAVAGFVLAQKADPLVLLVLPLLAPSLGLLVIDHVTNIGHIGDYINNAIRPLVREITREPRLLCYEERVDTWETRRLRRTLAFGLPLVLLFSVVPVYSLAVTVSKIETAPVLVLWSIGAAMTAFQVSLWVLFLAPPLRRPKRTPSP